MILSPRGHLNALGHMEIILIYKQIIGYFLGCIIRISMSTHPTFIIGQKCENTSLDSKTSQDLDVGMAIEVCHESKALSYVCERYQKKHHFQITSHVNYIYFQRKPSMKLKYQKVSHTKLIHCKINFIHREIHH